jgi:hypothetical protein
MLTLSDIFAPSASTLGLITLSGKNVPIDLKDQVAELLNISLKYKLLNSYETEIVTKTGGKVVLLLRRNVPLKDILSQILPLQDRETVKTLLL